MKIKEGDKVAIYMGDGNDDFPFEAEIVDINDKIIKIHVQEMGCFEVKFIKEDVQFGIPFITTNVLYSCSTVGIFKNAKSLYLFLARAYKDKSKSMMNISKKYRSIYNELKGGNR